MRKKHKFFFEAKNKGIKKLTKMEAPKKNKELQKLMNEIFDHFNENAWDNVLCERQHNFAERFFFDLDLYPEEIAQKQKQAKKKGLELFEFDDFQFAMGTFDELKKLFLEEKQFIENHLRKEMELESKRNNLMAMMKKNFQIDLFEIEPDDLLDLFLNQEKMEKIMRTIKNQAFW